MGKVLLSFRDQKYTAKLRDSVVLLQVLRYLLLGPYV